MRLRKLEIRSLILETSGFVLLIGSRFRSHKGFESFLEVTAGKKHATTTSFALDANVRTDAHDAPFITAAGMWFSQTNDIFDVYFNRHSESSVSRGGSARIIPCCK